jgi:DNA-binding response OmpR family regulator
VNAAIVTPFPRQGPLALLVLDADAVARCLVSDALRAEGLKVAEASTPDEARAVMGSMRVDLVLADLDPCGPAFGAWVRAQHPGARLLLASAEGGSGAAQAQLRKPYAVGEVVAQVIRSLSDPSRR